MKTPRKNIGKTKVKRQLPQPCLTQSLFRDDQGDPTRSDQHLLRGKQKKITLDVFRMILLFVSSP